jgi:nicotinamidase-related amidase
VTQIGEDTTVRTLVGRLDASNIDPRATALVVIDLQELCSGMDGQHARKAKELGKWADIEDYFVRVRDVVTPNVARIAGGLRSAGGTVIWARCRSLTPDARDNGRRFHDFGIAVGCDSPQIELIDGVELEHGDVLLDKTTASVFLSTNLNVMLRQMGVRSVITTGVVTSGCVESTVRDGCDLDYEVLLVEDACADRSDELHADSIRRMHNNFAVAMSTEDVLGALGTPTVLEGTQSAR